MAIKITYFVHGTTTDNEKEISSGLSDVGLSALGVKQSIELKGKIKDKKFDVVFCSDLKRAVDSAKLTFEGIVPIIPDVRLRECNYGQYNAQPSSIVEPMQEKAITERLPDGESYEDVKMRISDFLNFLKQHYDGKNVAIVAHKAPQLALDVLLKGKTWDEAFAEDWRKIKAWQPGWEYGLPYLPEKAIYVMRVVRGAFLHSKLLDDLGAKIIKKLDRSEWQSIDEVEVNPEQIRVLQMAMTRHYDDAKVPWYMDGYRKDNRDDVIVAFGADDGHGGRIFQFSRKDKATIDEVVKYGIGKGIPKGQMDFID